jgi:small subunit ribosomal protein S16
LNHTLEYGAGKRFAAPVAAIPATSAPIGQGFLSWPETLQCAAFPRRHPDRGIRCTAVRELLMVKIRLTRGGAKGRPFYHVVVTDQRNKRDGRSLERLGFFNPMAVGGEQRLQLDVAKVQGWVNKGAQLSDKVRVLVKEASRNVA